jgi:putative aminopeptidase FrvX
MKELLTRLSEVYGPSGQEYRVRARIKEEIKDHVDDLKEDALGNLMTIKKAKGSRNPVKIMVAAHMDEIGVMVTHIDENGFLRFANIGGVSPFRLIGQRVIFGNGLIGTIWNEPLDDISKLTLEKMYIDMGAEKKESTNGMVKIGDVATFHRPLEWMGKRCLGKAMDNRAGCAVAVEAIKSLGDTPNEVYFVFTSQEEVGLRGARTSAYALNPHIGIAIDVTGTGDTPEAKTMSVKLGAGAAIKVKDNSVICHPFVRDNLIKSAQSKGIPHQLEVLEWGGTDAGSIHLTREGIPSGAISIPCRYIHSPSEMVDLSDMTSAVALLIAFLQIPFEKTIGNRENFML